MTRLPTRAIQSIHQKLSKPAIGPFGGGVGSIWNIKWIPIALLYIFAAGCMAKDPWFGSDYFAWNQGVIVILLSYLIVSAVAFEWNLLGRARGINLLLQVLLIVPMAVFLGRILGRPTERPSFTSLLDSAADLFRKGLSVIGLAEWIPKWVQEVFTSPGLAVFLVLTCLALNCHGKKKRMGLLATAIAAATMLAIAYPPQPSLVFWVGVIFMCAGVSMQYLDINQLVAEEALLRRLDNVRDDAERRCSIRIVKRALSEGAVTEPTAIEIVRRCYGELAQLSPEQVLQCARTISYRLVHEHGALDIRGSERGMFLVPSPYLTRQDSLLEEVSLWPRHVILGTVAVLWLLSPVDLIPDSIPVLGVIDDAVILMVAGSPILSALARDHRRRRPELPERGE
jgi:hypothetical protein